MRLPLQLGSSGALLAATAAVIGYSNPTVDRNATAMRLKKKREDRARDLVTRCMAVNGIPGLSVGVSVDGRQVWAEGFGFADIETGAPCTEYTVMRIASISKPITATVAAILVDRGLLDLDQPIQKYLPHLSIKSIDNTPITTRMLLSHTSGIRHYQKKGEDKIVGDGNAPRTAEFYSNKPYATVDDAVQMFVNDELLAKPGTEFGYTTHGYTLASNVLERASGNKFPLDRNARIINDRAKYYLRSNGGRLENTPEVDNSYKWAGGGILSCVGDLLIFANTVLYSNQCPAGASDQAPLLSRETATTFWKGEIKTSGNDMMGLGWVRVKVPEGGRAAGADGARPRGNTWLHTGAAIGASSALLIEPRADADASPQADGRARGVCVAVLANLQHCSVQGLAEELAELFRDY